VHVVKFVILCILNNKEGISMRKKSEGGLAGSIPGLWVAGYVT
jgi:hypothetical protein